MDIDVFCDNSELDLEKVHPELIDSSDDLRRSLETQLQENQESIEQYHWLHKLINQDWWWQPGLHMYLRF